MLVKLLVSCFVSIVILPDADFFKVLISKQDYITIANNTKSINWTYTFNEYNYLTTQQWIDSENLKYQDIIR